MTVAEGSNHPALYTHSFTTLVPHWISHDPFRESCDLAAEEEICTPDRNHIHTPDRYSMKCAMRYRHQQPLRTCTIHQLNRYVVLIVMINYTSIIVFVSFSFVSDKVRPKQ